jgi:hypothetical protein
MATTYEIYEASYNYIDNMTNDTEKNTAIDHLMNILKNENMRKINKINSVSFNTTKGEKLRDLEDDYRQNDAQDQTTNGSFMEKYIYLIIQIIFCLLLLGIFCMKTLYNVKFDSATEKVKDKVSSMRLQTNNMIDKYFTNKNPT